MNKLAAARTVQALVAAPNTLLVNPRIGEQLEAFAPRDVRRILIGHDEMRYEIQASTIYVLAVAHARGSIALNLKTAVDRSSLS